jgi:tRNA A-37 threonylcarbamoyl transferase component Bud32
MEASSSGLSRPIAGHYTIERELGRGATATVYLARDTEHDQPVAIKMLRPELAQSLGADRFLREIKVSERLQHPQLVPVLDSGEHEGLLYFVLPHMKEGNLRQRLNRERQLPIEDAVAIAREIADALDHAHRQGLVHRDVKPENILFSDGHACLADFGIARAIERSADDPTTVTGVVRGTPAYMSPEQASGRHDYDGRSDIYSLACVLYEMIAGLPAFIGPTSEAVIAQRFEHRPRPLRVYRRNVRASLEAVIQRGLELAPADRYASAAEFARALERASRDRAVIGARVRRARRLTLVAAPVIASAAVILGLGMWYALGLSAPSLDANRIVVFPLHDPAARGDAGPTGEAVATFIGYALDGTRPLKWLDGWELLPPERRTSAARLDPLEARRLSERARAGFYIDGSIVRRPDSVTVILRLYSLVGDSVVRVEGASAGVESASVPRLGLQALRGLLPDLVSPGGKIDLAALSNRHPLAIANFLQGEREYRRMQFKPALAHYRAAIAADSAFAVAALRGAQAANWISDIHTALRLADIALSQARALPPAQALLTRGLHAYLIGSADSAVLYLRRALKADSTVHAGWTLLGEVYLRMLPSESPADSLARDALVAARQADRHFAPTLLLLEEMAVREGNVESVLALREELREAGADTSHARLRELMLRCVRDGPKSVDWSAAVQQDALGVLWSAKVLGGNASQSACAIPAYAALVQDEDVSWNRRWSALVGLQAQLAATNRHREAWAALRRKEVADESRRFVYLLLAAAGAGFSREAEAIGDSAHAESYDEFSAIALWHLAAWEARRKNAARVRDIVRVLRYIADSSGSRRDLALSRAITAQQLLLEGDSTAALRILSALTPTASRNEIAWQPWESLGFERLTLAELLYARGDLNAAYRVAAQLEASEPIVYPLYLRRSLELRAKIDGTLRERGFAHPYRHRIEALFARSDRIWVSR